MSQRHARPLAILALVLLAMGPVACNHANPMLRQSQLRAMQLHHHGTALATQRDQALGQAAQLAAQNQALQHRAAKLEGDLDIAHRRLDNLAGERSSLHEKYVGLLKKQNEAGSPLSNGTTRRFEDLARRYPEFEFDPATGVSRFQADILFDTGSAVVRNDAHPVVREFAQIMNDGDARNLKVLVVGHTDDRPIQGGGPTSQKHPTNWHLSTNRADSVVLLLEKFGLSQERMGAAGYSMFQPVAANTNESSRQANRRVEIYVLAPDAAIAAWDPTNVERR